MVKNKCNVKMSVSVLNSSIRPCSSQSTGLLLLSHTLTKLGSKAWEFSIPLLLVFSFGVQPIEQTGISKSVEGNQTLSKSEINRGRAHDTSTSERIGTNNNDDFSPLMYAGIFGLCVTICKIFILPVLGGRADDPRLSRLKIVTVAICSEFVSVLLATFVIVGLRADSLAEDDSDKTFNDFSTKLALFITLTACGIVESLGASMALNATKKDWIPVLYVNGSDKSLMNSRMSKIDLLCEIIGPVIAGTVIYSYQSGIARVDASVLSVGYVYIGVANLISFFAELGFLALVYSREYHLLRKYDLLIDSVSSEERNVVSTSQQQTAQQSNISLVTNSTADNTTPGNNKDPNAGTSAAGTIPTDLINDSTEVKTVTVERTVKKIGDNGKAGAIGSSSAIYYKENGVIKVVSNVSQPTLNTELLLQPGSGEKSGDNQQHIANGVVIEENTVTENINVLVNKKSNSATTPLKPRAGKSSGANIVPKTEKPTLFNSWTIFMAQDSKTYLLSISYALLWFNTLSPHGVVLTAYLGSQNVPSPILSLFRGFGALSGALAVSLFGITRANCGLIRSSLLHVYILAVCVLIVAWTTVRNSEEDGHLGDLNGYQPMGESMRNMPNPDDGEVVLNPGYGYHGHSSAAMRKYEHDLGDGGKGEFGDHGHSTTRHNTALAARSAPHGGAVSDSTNFDEYKTSLQGMASEVPMSLWIFFFGVIVSRYGLYGFDLGVLQLEQEYVKPNVRGRVAAVETSLCSLGTCGVYLNSIMFANNFNYQVYSSLLFVLLGSVVFSYWAVNHHTARVNHGMGMS